jgi:cytochrome c biogenesis protein CcmG/thiol:disulfide interchange protein DsbE
MKSGSFKTHYLVIGILTFFTLVTLGVLGKGLFLSPNTTESALIGKQAKPFQVTVLDGGDRLNGKSEVSLTDFAGKTLILNFWASWCESCREEAREFEAFWQAHSSEVIVLGVAIQDTPEEALAFAKTFGKTYPIALDVSGKAGIDYGVTGVPETFVIDPTGKIANKVNGPVTKVELERLLASIAK